MTVLITLEFSVFEHDKWLVRIQPCIYSANAFISIQGRKETPTFNFLHYMSSAQLTIIFVVKYWQITAFLFWLA